jgi:hypothetical protein
LSLGFDLGTFDAVEGERIVETVRLLLAKSFGITEASAMDFYADAHIALANPEEYVRTLLNIFGRGTSHILETIINGLGDEFGVAVTEAMTLGDCIGALRSANTGNPHA